MNECKQKDTRLCFGIVLADLEVQDEMNGENDEEEEVKEDQDGMKTG